MLRLLMLCALLFSAPALAQGKGEEVDVQIVLAVDVSYSMDPEEQRLQREGYIDAIRSPEVIEALKKGLIGKIAVSYIEWAGGHDQQTLIGWRVIDGLEAAIAWGEDLRSRPYRRSFRTSVSGAIYAGIRALEEPGFKPLRKVIDVSGDGANNDGPLVEMARDDAVAKGITINGLPLVLKRPNPATMDIDNLDDYYVDCVIGGPGSFSIPIRERNEFLQATRRKLIQEIAALPPAFAPGEPRIIPTRDKVDCLIGEKVWRQRRQMWQ